MSHQALIFSRYLDKQQEFLDFVLDQYIKAIHYAKVAEVMMQLRFWLQVAPLQANHITY